MYNENDVVDAALKTDFYSYVQRVFYEITGGETFVPNWHIEFLCYTLEQVRMGKIKRLIINVPPRSLKSKIVNVAFSTWVLGHNPKEEIISASYSSDLSDTFARDSKRVMESEWYKRIFPAARISASRSAANDFKTVSRGGRFSTSVEGTMTGRGGNLIIIDDPFKPSEARSEIALKKTNEWYQDTVSTRLNNPEDGVIIIIMQRVHENDLTGYLLEKSDKWTHVKIPQIATTDEVWETDRKIFQRKAGNSLDKDRMSIDTVLSKKKEHGTYVWASQYQQDPCSFEDGIIREEWLHYYDPLLEFKNNHNSDCRGLFISWDTANKSGDENDYSAYVVILVKNGKLYLLEAGRGKWEAPELMKQIREIYHKWKYTEKGGYLTKMLIEDSSSGATLAPILKQETDNNGYFFNIETIKPTSDKKSRLLASSVFIENGDMLFPKGDIDWWPDFKKELLSFPGSKHDDQVDALTQCIQFATTAAY